MQKSQQADIKWLIYATKISQYFKCHYWSPLVFLPCQCVPVLVTVRLPEIEAVAGTFQLLLSQVAWQCLCCTNAVALFVELHANIN